jgi:hypothetical protein
MYMGVKGFIGLEWMPNTHTPVSNDMNESKKKDKFINFYFKP